MTFCSWFDKNNLYHEEELPDAVGLCTLCGQPIYLAEGVQWIKRSGHSELAHDQCEYRGGHKNDKE